MRIISVVNPTTASHSAAALHRAVLAALAQPGSFKNVFIPVYDQVATPTDLIKTFEKRTGVKARRVPNTTCDAHSDMCLHLQHTASQLIARALCP